jgi:hypothetical protein
MNYNKKISELQNEIRIVKRIMKSEDKSQFQKFIHLQNELDRLLILNISTEKKDILEKIAMKYGREIKNI